jgi:hypothetical protein
MPFILIVVGLIAFVIGVRGTHKEASQLLRDSFSGERNFITWIFAIGTLGVVGYVPVLRPVTRGFIALILIVMLLSNDGFFGQLQRQLLNRPRSMGAAGGGGVSPATTPAAGGLAPVPPLASLPNFLE